MKKKDDEILHQVAGRPLIHYPIELGWRGAERIVLVLGHQRDAIEGYVDRLCRCPHRKCDPS